MKLRFLLISSLLLFSRGCDFYSTSLWFFQENGIADEMNPLTRFFGVGWSGLIFVNILIVLLILGMYYFYCFYYKLPVYLPQKPQNYREYTSVLYYGQKGKFYQILYKIPKNLKALAGHYGYVIVRMLIIGSFMATFHNISQYYGFTFYDQFRLIVKRPLFVIYALIILSGVFFYMRLLQAEFLLYKSVETSKKEA